MLSRALRPRWAAARAVRPYSCSRPVAALEEVDEAAGRIVKFADGTGEARFGVFANAGPRVRPRCSTLAAP